MANRIGASDSLGKANVKRFQSHTFTGDEEGDEYGGSKFGGFGDYFRNKKLKLQNKDAYLRESAKADQAPQLFRGMAMYVNGYTQPSLNDLNVLVVRHGGVFLQYLDGKTAVTHIIASSLTPKKRVEFAKYRIVKPAWVVESVERGVLMPWTDYKVVEEAPGQSLLGFGTQSRQTQSGIPSSSSIVSQKSRTPVSYKSMPSMHSPSQSSQMSSVSSIPSFKPYASISQERTPTKATGQLSLSEGSPIIELPKQDFTGSQVSAASSQPPQSSTDYGGSDIFDDDNMDLDFIQGQNVQDQAGAQAPQSEEAENEEVTQVDEQVLTLKEDISDDDARAINDDAEKMEDEGEHEEDDHLRGDVLEEIRQLDKKSNLTALENNAALLSNPRIRSNTVLNPEFLTKYYSESRLHHLSNWKAELKAHFQSLTSSQEKKPSRLPANNPRRYVAHVDFDCFFAAISLRSRPELKDKPVGVGHSSGPSSEIASCNYAAREFGIKNGMWMKQATELCPNLTILPYDFPVYEEASKAFYDVLLGAGARAVQSVSVDEALLDITNLCTSNTSREEDEVETADHLAKGIRDRIRELTKCDVSVGIGGNVLLAKLALRKAKPAGQHQIRSEDILDFIGPLPIRDLPGVGYHISARIEEDLHCATVAEVRALSKEKLKVSLGEKTGEKLWNSSRGIDKTEVGEVSARKSVSADVNWGVRFETNEQVDEFMYNLSGELQRRLLAQNVRGGHLTVKLMRRREGAPLNPPKYLGHGPCDTFNKSASLRVPTNDQQIIGKESSAIMKSFNCPAAEIRGIGLMMSKLSPISDLPSSQKKLNFSKAAASGSSTVGAMAPPPVPITPVKNEGKNKENFKMENRTPLRLPKRPQASPMMSQFLVPSQIDNSVLQELPEDIREKIAQEQTRKRQQKAPTPQPAPPQSPAPAATATISPQKPKLAFSNLANQRAPSQSQLDPEVLNSLPPDLRAEVLAEYSAARGAQTLLPQSPRKNRLTSVATASTRGRKAAAAASPSKRKADGLFSNASRVPPPAFQSFVSAGNNRGSSSRDSPPSSPPPFDKDVLAELPEDIRREVLAQAREEKLRAKKKALAAAERSRIAASKKSNRFERVYKIPAPPGPAVIQGASSLKDVRNLITQWFNSCKEEGPHEDDLKDFEVYLDKVVRVEKDVEKAVSVVKWLQWVVDEGDGCEEWKVAISICRECVGEACEKRGLRGVEM